MAGTSKKRNEYSRPLMSDRNIPKITFTFRLPQELMKSKRRKVEDETSSSRNALLEIQPTTDGHLSRTRGQSKSISGSKSNVSVSSGNNSSKSSFSRADSTASYVVTDAKSNTNIRQANSDQDEKTICSNQSINNSSRELSSTEDAGISASSAEKSNRTLRHSKSKDSEKYTNPPSSVKNSTSRESSSTEDDQQSAISQSEERHRQSNRTNQHLKSHKSEKSTLSIRSSSRSSSRKLTTAEDADLTSPSSVVTDRLTNQTDLHMKSDQALKPLSYKNNSRLEAMKSYDQAQSVDNDGYAIDNEKLNKTSQYSKSVKESKSLESIFINTSGLKDNNETVSSGTSISTAKNKSHKRKLQEELPSRTSDNVFNISKRKQRWSNPLLSPNLARKSLCHASADKDFSKLEMDVVHHSIEPSGIEAFQSENTNSISRHTSPNVNKELHEFDDVESDSSTSTIERLPPAKTCSYIDSFHNGDHICLISPVKGMRYSSKETGFSEIVQRNNNTEANDTNKQKGDSRNKILLSEKKVRNWLSTNKAAAQSRTDLAESTGAINYEKMVIELMKTKKFPLSKEALKTLKESTALPRMTFNVQCRNDRPKSFGLPIKKYKKPLLHEKGIVLDEVLVYNHGINKHTLAQISDLEIMLSHIVKTFREMRKEYTDDQELFVLKRYHKIVTNNLMKVIANFALVQRKQREVNKLKKDIARNSEKLGKKTDRILRQNAGISEEDSS